MNKFFVFLLIYIFFLSSSALCSQSGELMRKGNAFAAKKQYKQAAECYEKLVSMKPSDPVLKNNLGFLYAEMGYYRQALDLYEEALKLKPSYKDAENNILAAAARYAQELIESGKYDSAVSMLESVKRRFPDAGEIYYFLGVAYQAQGKFKEALDEWKKSADINPDSSIALYVEGIEKIIKGDKEGAVKVLKASLEKMPDNAYAGNMLGILQVQAGRLDEAQKTFETVIKRRPNYVEAYFNLAYLAERRSDIQTAVKYYKMASVKNPYSLKALMAMGKIYFQTNRFFDAESCYKRASRLFPFSSDLHKSLALTYAKQNKYPLAVEEFETAARMNPDDAEAWYALGALYQAAGAENSEYLKKAEQAFQKCASVKDSSYAPLAESKLAQLGAGSFSSNDSPSMANSPGTFAPRAVTAESPEGDLSLSIPPEWTEVPASSGGDKYLWLMSLLEKGALFTVYRPSESSGESVALAEAEKRMNELTDIKKSTATFSGRAFSVYEGKTKSGQIRIVYVAFNKGKTYMFEAEIPKSNVLSEIEKIMNSVVLR